MTKKIKKIIAAISLITTFSIFLITQEKDNKREEYIKAVKTEIEKIKAIIPQKKNPLDDYLRIAHLYTEIEDYDNALIYYSLASTIEPNNPHIYYKMAMIYETKKDNKSAIENWQNVIRYSKNKKIIEIAQKHIYILQNSK